MHTASFPPEEYLYIGCLKDADVCRATRHYRRAVAALGALIAESATAVALEDVLHRLGAHLLLFEHELQRRGLEIEAVLGEPEVGRSQAENATA